MNDRPVSNPWLSSVLDTTRRWLLSDDPGLRERPRIDPTAAHLHAHRARLRALWLAHGGGNPSRASTQGRVSSATK